MVWTNWSVHTVWIGTVCCRGMSQQRRYTKFSLHKWFIAPNLFLAKLLACDPLKRSIVHSQSDMISPFINYLIIYYLKTVQSFNLFIKAKITNITCLQFLSFKNLLLHLVWYDRKPNILNLGFGLLVEQDKTFNGITSCVRKSSLGNCYWWRAHSTSWAKAIESGLCKYNTKPIKYQTNIWIWEKETHWSEKMSSQK